MNDYADNLRKSIINTQKRFVRMVEDVREKQKVADREELDTMWQQALTESVKDGEQFTRYHFANLVAAAEREACALTCEGIAADDQSEDSAAQDCAAAIRARGDE